MTKLNENYDDDVPAWYGCLIVLFSSAALWTLIIVAFLALT